jgi:aryl-alcohol dehydrogenase-like predicted oxidoreductase
METKILGKTGLRVSRLGAGLSRIGRLGLEAESQASEVLNIALDSGITFLDTAACYWFSEQLIGRTIAHRRTEYVLCTKCGHRVPGYEGQEWSARLISNSVENSLRCLKTDHLDLLLLHSCDLNTLQNGESVQAILKAKEQGKTRYIGYSEPNAGDNRAVRWIVDSGLFDALETSFNLAEQRALFDILTWAEECNLGIIIKQPIAEAAWGLSSAPSWQSKSFFERSGRMAALGPLPDAPQDPILLALGFVLAHPEVDTAIVGTANPKHMRENIDRLRSLPISTQTVEELHRRYLATA